MEAAVCPDSAVDSPECPSGADASTSGPLRKAGHGNTFSGSPRRSPTLQLRDSGMAVRIRLRRMGRKKQPHYRVVVADSASPRDGRFVENLGFYRPLSNPARLVLDLERVDHWLSEGALPSTTVKNLIDRARKGGDDTVAVGEDDPEARKAKQAEELAARRAAEKKAAEEAAAAEAAAKAEAEAAEAEEVPEDVADAPEGSSADDATPAEAKADGAEAAVEDAEAEQPEAPAEESKARADVSSEGPEVAATEDAGASGEEPEDEAAEDEDEEKEE